MVIDADKKDYKVIIKDKDLHRPFYEFVKRIFDVFASLVGLIVLSPVFLITAIAVKTDGGRVFYTQTRVGKDEVPFKLYKFRSMCENADTMKEKIIHLNEADGPVFKIKDDPRVTKVGKFIRKYSIDELPQLINILKGDMSVVGPRPALPEEVEKYTGYQRQRLMIKPGLTCFWQAYGRSDLSFNDWMDMDITYIKVRRFGIDLRLILKTVYAVIFTRGAY